MRRYRTLLFSFLVLANSAFANTFTTDLTDLWWNANESGWGVTATHQREVVFLTFFVYGSDNKPTFYTASTSYAGLTGQGALIFSGPIYQTSGPWLGTFFNPAAVGVRQVGNATFSAFIDAATLTYSVDGTPVTKALTRQTFRNNDLTGQYGAIGNATLSGCSNPAMNGTYEVSMVIGIATSSTTFSMTTDTGVSFCTHAGSYTQTGRMGRSKGTVSCPGQSLATYDLLEIEATPRSFTARVSYIYGSGSACLQGAGYLVGAKR